MNTQRWITVAVFSLLIVCVGTTGLWIPLLPFGDDGEEVAINAELTATAEAESQLPDPEITATPTSLASIEEIVSGQVNLMAEEETDQEVDPVVAELLAALQKETIGVGEDPYIIKVGNFVALDSMRKGEGTAAIYVLGENEWVLRLDPFTVAQGPDLHVILSQTPGPKTSGDALLPKYVDLGPLRGIEGAQNYVIPPDIEINRYKSVVIYSVTLNIIYTTATLTDVRGG